jgi:hypothetical protein|tara:strand:- start:1636 stop:1920 length:285 start_codon:yes stop_codon:yes gene_type:complete
MYKSWQLVTCADGFSVSIQAGKYSYSEPSTFDAPAYESVELGFPNRPCMFIKDYAEVPGDLTRSIYGYVPAHVVRKMIAAHGGIVSGQCPPLVE